MTSVKVRLYTYRANKEGTFPLVFQIIHSRKKRVIYTPFHLNKENFNNRKNCVVTRRRGTHIPVDKINEYIRKLTDELDRVIDFLDSQNMTYSVDDIVELYKSNQNNKGVLVYIKKLMVQLHEENRMGTLNAYKSTLNRLIRFPLLKENFCFCDLNVRWINNFIAYLKKEGLKENTISFYCRVLRAVYNRAYNEGIVGANGDSPFNRVSFSSVKTVKRAIKGEYIKKIANAKLSFDYRLERARDFFLFSFYCRGMSFIDMAYLRYENIMGDVIYYKRKKTGQPLRVKIVSELQKIIDKYKNDGPYLLPVIVDKNKSSYMQYRNELRKFNNYLKKLSVHLNLGYNLTSYVARHSWATLARDSGAPVSVISESLGHNSEKVTYTYLAALDPALVDSVNEKISCMYH